MKRYIIKQIIKFSILGVILVFATMFVYDSARDSYQKYLDKNKDDSDWIRSNINLVEDTRIGSGVLRPDMPSDLTIENDLYNEAIKEEIDQLLINNYKVDNPLFIYNPYKLDNTTVNIYFHTGNNYKFEYYVTTKAIGTLDNISYIRVKDDDGNDILSTKQFYILRGFTPGKKNNLLIRILDGNDMVVDTENFILNIPAK